MKHSIRFKFTVIFIAITTALVVGIFLANKYLLSSYYFNQKVKDLESVYSSINQIVEDSSGDPYSISVSLNDPEKRILKSLNGRSNADLVIIGEDEKAIVNTGREVNWLTLRLKAYLEFRDTIKDGNLPDYKLVKNNGNYIIQQKYDKMSDAYMLEAWGTFTDGKTSFLIQVPVQGIEESVSITNRFIAIVGIIAIFVGGIVVFLATNLITRPINKLAHIATKMSNLDFSEKYTGKEQDEIGVLGSSINTMSEKLEKTITDLKEANIRLQEDISMKEKIDTARKDFISNVSHELKTPIALIEGYAEGLTEGMAEDPESRDYYCSVIMDEAGKMNTLVKQLTSLTNYEFGQNQVEREDFDLTELVKNVLKREKLKAEEKQAVIETRLMEPCMVNADEFKIEEVLTNYLTNAFNHLSGKKCIIITEEPIDARRVKLSVYNDGEPIPEECLPDIWDKFYKVDKARTREYGGSGIGLSIVKAIMEAHGQGYGVRNTDEGVEFFITLDYIG